MKWPWSKNRSQDVAPEFWKEYNAAFAKAKIKPLSQTRFVAFDTETTGLDPKNDRILSIGAVALVGKEIQVQDSLELYIKQETYKKESAQIHGILKGGDYEKLDELAAIQKCLEFIGTDVLVAHHAGFDLRVVNEGLKRYGLGKLQNKVIDTERLYKAKLHKANALLRDKRYSLDDLAEALKIPLHDRHTAAGDAFITAMAFIKILHNIENHSTLTLQKLYTL